MPTPGAPAGPSVPDIIVAVAAILSVVVGIGALMVSTRSFRVASVEAFPIAVDRLYLGVELRNFGPRHANNVDWSIVLRDSSGGIIEEQSLKVPVMAVDESRRVLMGWIPAPGQKRTLAALAKAGGSLESSCRWEDARGFVIAKHLHRTEIVLPLGDVLANVSGALQRDADDSLAAIRDLGAALLAIRDSIDACCASRSGVAPLTIDAESVAPVRQQL
jgi:hypothetical protein